MRNDELTPPEELLSTTQVAQMCSVAPMTVIRWIDAGVLPATRTPGGWRRVRRSDAERHAAKVAGRAEPPRMTVAQLARLLASGERHTIVEWARQLAGTTTSVRDIIRDLIAPAMQRIGDEWECGRLSVAEEHRATAIAYDMVVLLRDLVPPAAERVNLRMLLVCPADEQHAFPARLAAERFVDLGWDVDYLGADVPAEDVVAQLDRTGPDALGISVTCEPGGARQLVLAVHRGDWDGPILMGGALAAEVAEGLDYIVVDDRDESFAERFTQQLLSKRRNAG